MPRNLLATPLVLIAVCGSADADTPSNNELFVIQDSLSSNTGNALYIDQSQAVESVVAGLRDEGALTLDVSADPANVGVLLDALAPDPRVPARQIGGNNAATITIAAQGGHVGLSQTHSGAGGPNIANVELGALGMGSSASIFQDGAGNTGEITMGRDAPALSSQARLFQRGDANRGHVDVSGSGVSGTLVQSGRNNSYDLQVSGPQGTNVIWQQIGDNLKQSPATQAQVSSFGSVSGTVIVRQYMLTTR